jgi:Na+/proline symporter
MLAIIGVSISANLAGIDPDLAMVEGLIHLVPSGFLGLGLVIFFASIMSSADSLLFASVSIVLQDFLTRSRPAEKEKLVKLFRYSIGLLLIVCFFLSIWLKNIVTATYIGVAFGCVVAVVALTSWWIKKARPIMLVGGIAAGFVGTCIMIFIRPVNESLILLSVAFTTLGVILGKICGYCFSEKKRRVNKKAHI